MANEGSSDWAVWIAEVGFPIESGAASGTPRR
jgi:hypothetical protein